MEEEASYMVSNLNLGNIIMDSLQSRTVHKFFKGIPITIAREYLRRRGSVIGFVAHKGRRCTLAIA